MNREEIFSILKNILHEGTRGKIDPNNVTEKSDLVAEGYLDSFQALKILLQVEEKFNIDIDDEDLNIKLFRSISNFIDYIAQKRMIS